MKLKSSRHFYDKILRHLKIAFFRFFGRRPVQIVSKVLLCVFLISFFTSAWFYRKDIDRYVVKRVLYKTGLMPNPKRITIDISHKNYLKIAYKREIALSRGVNFSSSEDYVPAMLTVDNEAYRIKMRLKGDSPDHWGSQKQWSFRIRVKDDKTILGMKQFSIQRSVTREHLVEWLYHQLQEYVGLISLRYDYVEVVLNGKNLGLYAVEEHFDKLLIENNHYREGPIVRFNDSSYWIHRSEKREDYIDYQEAYWLGPVDVFHPARTERSPQRLEQFQKAKNLLERLRRRQMKAHQVFDVDKLAMYFAILDLWGNAHAAQYHNSRFYYNPVTSRLIPIGFDSSDLLQAKALVGSTQEYQQKSDLMTWEWCLFEDEILYRKYIQALKQVSAPEFVDHFLKTIQTEYGRVRDIVYACFPHYTFEKMDMLKQNQEFIRKTLDPTIGIQAYFYKAEGKEQKLHLQIGNIQFMPIEIVGVSVGGKDVLALDEPVVLRGKIPSAPVEYKLMAFTGRSDDGDFSKEMISKIKVQYRVMGMDDIKEAFVYKWPYLNDDFMDNDFIRKGSQYKNSEFLVVDDSLREIVIKPGAWNIEKDIVIPEGYTVIANEYTELNLKGRAKIISYSPVRFIGTEDHPLVITSNDSTGQGIAVLKAQGPSVLRHVIFTNLAAPKASGWELLGAVNFYESPVAIDHCLFQGNRDSDDLLNIIRSDFTIDKSSFEKSYADAIDIDFSQGAITDSSFVESGAVSGNGDGIDFSGSVVTLSNIIIRGVSDKGLSVGERSQVSAENIKISNAQIGIASKDSSNFKGEGINISHSGTALAVYQKKAEFGPATIKIKTFKHGENGRVFSVQDGSSIMVDGRTIIPGEKD